MKKLLVANPKKWLISGLVVMVGLLVALARVEVSSAHPPQPILPTTTPTPIPEIQACQVTEIIFLDFADPSVVREAYEMDETIKVRVKVADDSGMPLVGAKVVAEVTRQSFTQAAAGFGLAGRVPLEDRAGAYDGLYTKTDAAGDYDFSFRVSDPSGERFLPCSGQATVRVNPKSTQCDITVTSPKDEYELNETVVLTANVTVDSVVQSGAVVTASVTRPNGQPDNPINFTGSGPYNGRYSKTDMEGDYIFSVSASDSQGKFLPCSPDEGPITVKVVGKSACEITAIDFDQDRYTVGDTIHLTATVTNTHGVDAVVTATVQSPGGGSGSITLPGSGSTYTGSYTDTVTPGDYRFKVTASDPTGQNFATCTKDSPKVPVDPVTKAIVKVVPKHLPTDLCSLLNTSAINVEKVSNLVAVELEITYDPDVIQVIDANAGQRGVQVRVGDIFANAVISKNIVDTRHGRISFAAERLDVYTALEAPTTLILIDWRPHHVGTSPVTLAEVVLTDHNGQAIEVTRESGTVEVAPVFQCSAGIVTLEGRTDHSGVIVTNSAGEQTQTQADGFFAIAGGDDIINLEFPGYLSAQADLRQHMALEQAENGLVELGTIRMLAGDVNEDNVVTILDLAYIARHYLTADPLADLNGDGVVNILDLALVASNYRQQGPLTAWQ